MVFQMFFHRKNLRYHENITKIIQKIRSLIFSNQKSSNEDYTYIQRQTPQKPFIFLPA